MTRYLMSAYGNTSLGRSVSEYCCINKDVYYKMCHCKSESIVLFVCDESLLLSVTCFLSNNMTSCSALTLHRVLLY